MKTVVILRGAAGSGKSTYIKNNFSNTEIVPVICSADHYFETSGTYKFDSKKLSEAHKFCMRRFIDSLVMENNLVIVDNTNIKLEHFIGYIQIARAMDYQVKIVRLNTPPEVAAGRNVHNVPEKTVMEMYKSFQAIPKYLGITEEVVSGI